MTLTNLNKVPFPWFGGKSQASPIVWAALGDVEHYVEPFCGSMSVLLNRPHLENRPYHSETVCDRDGLLINAWRGIQFRPDETAEAASNPVAEADLHARHLALVRWRAEHELEHLMGDPDWCDPKMAGWWLWGCCCWIGSGWCEGTHAWVLGPGDRLTRRKDLPADWISDHGVSRQLPHLADDGKGVNQTLTREPGVSRQLPHLANDGKGVNQTLTREPGVFCKLPHLADDGKGVNNPGIREPGVSRQRPQTGDDGRGVNYAGTREPGVSHDDIEFHPVVMPELRRWFHYLSARLRHVRIVNGDWTRVVTSGAVKTLNIRQKNGCAGIFLDPPYANTADRIDGLYAVDSADIAHTVRDWAIRNGDDPQLRIVMAGYVGEHGDCFTAAGWREVEWFVPGFLRGGMGNLGKDGNQQHRERLWLSPHTLKQEVRATAFEEMFDLPQEGE